MSRRLLVPLTDSTHSWPGLEHALERYPDSEIVVLNVVDTLGAGYGERAAEDAASDTDETEAEELFAAADELAGGYGMDVDTAVVEGRPAEAIIGYADDHAIDQIIMGSRSRSGISRVLLGSVAGTVVQDSPVPVTVVP